MRHDTEDIMTTPDMMTPLPIRYGRPNIRRVARDNGHGTGWTLIESGDQGPDADDMDRYYARFESAEGYWADYFYTGHGWTLGAS